MTPCLRSLLRFEKWCLSPVFSRVSRPRPERSCHLGDIGLDLRRELLGRVRDGLDSILVQALEEIRRLMIATESSWIFFTISRGVPAGP